MSWVKAFFLWLFRIPVTIRRVDVILHGEPVEEFNTHHYQTWANVFYLVPGLEESWRRALGEAIAKMAETPAEEKFNLERLRLCQRVVDIWQNLNMARAAAKQLQDYYRVTEEIQNGKKVEQQGSKNVIGET